jgi:hypothetical protein
MARRFAWLLTSLLTLLIVGCGGSDSHSQRSASSQPPRDASPAPPPTPQIAPSVRAKRVVRRYYARLGDGNFSGAWSLLAPGAQEAKGGFTTWKKGYDLTVDTTVTRLEPLLENDSRVLLDVGLRSVDIDECGDTVRQRFAGTWTVQRTGGKWKATRSRFHRIAGREPVRDAAGCIDSTPLPSDGAPSSPPPSSDYGAPSDSTPSSPDFCDTHDCIPNYPNGNGSTVQCNDGSFSQSGGIQGACSHHGGVAGP